MDEEIERAIPLHPKLGKSVCKLQFALERCDEVVLLKTPATLLLAVSFGAFVGRRLVGRRNFANVNMDEIECL